MLCSKCSEHLLPLVAIDIDGTLGDYHGHFLKFAESYLGVISQFHYGGKEKYSEWFCEQFEVDLTTFRQVKLAYRQGGMKRTMPMYTGAKHLIDFLQTTGTEVWLTTTRPYLRLDNIDPDTRFWLDRHEIRPDGMLYDEKKYQVLADRVDPKRVAAILDDTPEQYDEAEEVFGNNVPIFRMTRYNHAARGDRNNVSNLEAALDSISARVGDWRRVYGS